MCHLEQNQPSTIYLKVWHKHPLLEREARQKNDNIKIKLPLDPFLPIKHSHKTRPLQISKGGGGCPNPRSPSESVNAVFSFFFHVNIAIISLRGNSQDIQPSLQITFGLA